MPPVALVTGALALSACRAHLGDDAFGEVGPDAGAGSATLPTGAPVPDSCFDSDAPVSVGITKLRRLTRAVLERSILDLTGVAADAEAALSPDERIGPFDSNAIAPITELLVQQSQELAERVALEMLPALVALVPCDVIAADATCARQFAGEFAGRAFRRPLEEVELERFVALFELGRAGSGAEHGLQLIVEAVLQSPSFLYHVDVGISGRPSATPELLDAYGLAARLAFFLWQSLPDAELMDLARTGAISDVAVLRAQAVRLLEDSRSAPVIGSFHRQWLGLEGLLGQAKDPNLFPSFDLELAQAMLDEVDRFTNYVVREQAGTLATLFTANVGFPDARLAPVYGVAPSADPNIPVSLPADQRSGILTQAAFLGRHAHGNQTSPVHRGLVVRENVLCQPILPPPADVAVVVPPPSEATTTRERFAAHVADRACAGCHEVIDPPGLAFEHYDAIGRYRTHEGSVPVDASGEMIQVGPELSGEFGSAMDLVLDLSVAPEVRECTTRQWFRFALGRIESDADVCSVNDAYQTFSESGGTIRELLLAIALSEAFRYVRSTAEGAPQP